MPFGMDPGTPRPWWSGPPRSGYDCGVPGTMLRREPDGTLHLRPAAIPVAVAAIALPIVAAMLLGTVTVGGIGPGLAAGAAVAATLIVVALRAAPRERMEVAPAAHGERRVLVVATTDATPGAAATIGDLAAGASDVRLLVPLRTRRLDRWLSAEDAARGDAERRLAHAAGALVAAGLPVSGSLGDSDLGQALEDELRSYAADEVILLSESGAPDELGDSEARLGLPLRRVEAHAQ